ncbi:5-oxoprolinase subunit PxpB [Peribacillus sp. SCS-37]|uniref:5-oxoprolinase subunit PxpB n=1 Tax=Paraperibacillus esterisolvens TaxID=3115296 RepID=UPI003905A949
MEFELYPLGDGAVVIELGKEISPGVQHMVRVVSALLDEQESGWLVEYVPAFTTVTVFYDIVRAASLSGGRYPFQAVTFELKKLLRDPGLLDIPKPRIVDIPVCYGGRFGPDLGFVAEYNGLTPEEVILIHAGGEYDVHMIGFAPGFPYLGGMSERIAAPRKETPRLKIPERSVGIAGNQTGIYPIETPGGWQLIGRTPLSLFQPDEESPSLLRAGDRVRFRPVPEKEYAELSGGAG